MKASGFKSLHVTFTTRKRNEPPGRYKQRATPPRRCQVSSDYTLRGDLPGKTETTRNHPHQNVLVTRRKVKTLYKQQTFHIYKTILKPIWTYGIQLWGTASISNIDILVRF
jgi:hypothetical protein